MVKEEPLKNIFPRLYGISKGKDKTIEESIGWYNRIWKWKLPWRRNIFFWEAELM